MLNLLGGKVIYSTDAGGFDGLVGRKSILEEK